MKNTHERITLGSERSGSGRSLLTAAVLAAAFSSSHRHTCGQKTSTGASAACSMLSMNCMKPSSTTDGTAGRRITSVANYTRHESAAGASVTSGGMNTSTAGTRNVIGTSTITTATNASCSLGAKLAVSLRHPACASLRSFLRSHATGALPTAHGTTLGLPRQRTAAGGRARFAL